MLYRNYIILSLPRPTAGRRLKASSAESPLDADFEGKFEGQSSSAPAIFFAEANVVAKSQQSHRVLVVTCANSMATLSLNPIYPHTPCTLKPCANTTVLLFHHWALSVGHGPSGAVDRYGANLLRAGGAVPRLGRGGEGRVIIVNGLPAYMTLCICTCKYPTPQSPILMI